MNFPTGEPITLLRNGAATENRFGDPVPSQADPVVVLGAFDPGGSSEDSSQDTAATQPEVYLPPGTDVSWVDAVQIDGVTYQVDGPPRPLSSPFTGTAFGVIVKLRGILAEPR